MRFGSLFSGIGGLDLGLERAGHVCAWQVELDPYCQAVLRKHWPDVPKYPDVRTVGDELERVELVCGGFPCQPVSLAGRRRGAADERWLWPEFARILRLLRPRYALLENVPGLLAGGGMAEVLGDLAALGFDAEWDCIPAAAVGAPHLRYRVFIVAYADQFNRRSGLESNQQGAGQPAGRSGGWSLADAERDELRDEPGRRDGSRRTSAAIAGDDGANGHVADAEGVSGKLWAAEGEQLGRSAGGGDDVANSYILSAFGTSIAWSKPHPWAVEPDVGRVAHGVPSRVDRLRALGNAVVPQVAEVIGWHLQTSRPLPRPSPR